MIYKGSTPVSFASKGTIEKTIIKDSNNNVVQTMYVTDEPDILESEQPVITEWTRPVAWPNLDLISIPSDFEGIYLTYDNTISTEESWAGFYCDMSGGNTYTVAVGHLNGSTWVQDTSYSATKNTYLYFNYKNLNLNYDYLVFKLTPTSSSYHFTRFGFGQVPVATTGNVLYEKYWYQHCLERRGRLPYITSTTYSGENYGNFAEWIECDNVIIGESNTGNMNLTGAFRCGKRLQKVNLNDWPASQWNVTGIAAMFYLCHMLEDVSAMNNWNTTNWYVTGVNDLFNSCFKLKKCGVSNWVTTNWGSGTNKTLSFASMFYLCGELEEIDLNNWDTSLMRVTSLSSTFNGCFRVKRIKIDKWNTSNWAVTSLYGVFASCYQLLELDLSGWNTSNWAVTRMDSCFSGCNKLRDLTSIEKWNVSNWPMNNANYNFGTVFSACYKITSLNLNSWNVSGWRPTNISSLFSNCYNLRKLEVGQWDTSNWPINNIGSLLSGCRSLKHFTGFNWDTSNWVVDQSITYMFNNCNALEEIDLSKWDTSKFNIGNVSMTYFCTYCYAAKKIDLSTLNLGGITTLANTGNGSSTSLFYQCYNVEEIKMPQNYKGYVRLTDCFKLSRSQIVAIFNGLPSTSTTIGLQVGEIRHKLTSADIAIVTSKGYTVS